MRSQVSIASVLVCGLFFTLSAAACDDQPTSPPEPEGEEVAQATAQETGTSAIEGQVNRLIDAIYPSGEMKRNANRAFADTKSALAHGDTATARDRMFDFVEALTNDARAGELKDPEVDDEVSVSTAREGAAALTRNYFEFVGLAAPPMTAAALEESGAAEVVDPDQGAQVKTGDGKGGVNIPPGGLEEPALVTMERQEDPQTVGDAPIPQNLALAPHPPFYDVETTTQPTDDGVLVGICVPTSGPVSPAAELQDDLRVIRKPDGASEPEFLPEASADFVDCESDEIAVAGRTTGFSSFGGGTSPDAIQTATGHSFTCALREDGQAFCWGENQFGQLGDGTTTPDSVPVPVDQSVDGGVLFDSLTVGIRYACARTSGGAAYCWGRNATGQLGDGTQTARSVPVPVQTTVDFVQINAGAFTTCGIESGGQAYCWGAGASGQLGDGAASSSTTPVAVDQSGGLSFEEVRAGYVTSCARTSGGQAYCWGRDLSYAPVLGTQSYSSSPTPVPVDQNVDGGVSFTQLTTGIWNNCALASDGQAYCWGGNFRSLLGISPGCTSSFGCTPAKSAVPVPVDQSVDGGVSFAQVDGSYQQHNCGLTSGGQAYCWSLNFGGQLGDGSSGNQRPVPVPVEQSVDGGVLFSQLSAGYYHTCAVTTDGEVYCWGENESGEIGDGTTVPRLSPVKVGS